MPRPTKKDSENASAEAQETTTTKYNERKSVRRIRVKAAYIGAPSGGRWIYPGAYDENDQALFGLAKYLVNVAHDAEWIED